MEAGRGGREGCGRRAEGQLWAGPAAESPREGARERGRRVGMRKAAAEPSGPSALENSGAEGRTNLPLDHSADLPR